MTAVAMNITPGAPLPAEPEAPMLFHVDVAEIVRDAAPRVLATRMPHPEKDAMELQLLVAAQDCAAGGMQLPRRELVAVALREVASQEWWRVQAEAEAAALKRELATLESAHALQVQDLRQQRRGLMQLLFEIVAWASPVLGCEPSGRDVIAAIRAKGSGSLQHEHDGSVIDRAGAEDDPHRKGGRPVGVSPCCAPGGRTARWRRPALQRWL